MQKGTDPQEWEKVLIGQAELKQCPVSKAATTHLYTLTKVERAVAQRVQGS